MTGPINVPAQKDILRSANGFSLWDNNITFLIRKDDATIAAFGPTLITSLVPIKLPADPAQPLEAATKQYVDSRTGGGVTNPVAGSQAGLTMWLGTQAQYDAIATKDAKTVYNITG